MTRENRRRNVICLNQPQGISGIEFAAILKRKTDLTTQPSQLCVDSGTLRHRHSRHFWLTFLQAFINCDCGRHIKQRASYREAESYVSHHQTSKHQCTGLGTALNLNSQASSPFLVRDESRYKAQNETTKLFSVGNTNINISTN